MLLPRFLNVGLPRALPPNLVEVTNYTPIDVAIDILIPVYKGYEQTKTCIESVLNSNLNSNTRLIVIDDCSPDEKINLYLNKLSNEGKIKLYRNNVNQGFVSTVNFGMRLSESHDVILLNSDTEVCGDWINKLKWHAYSRPRVASVTPFSNNATICSYPDLHGFIELPSRSNLQDFDRAFFLANKHKNICIPTAVGFCMYIRRECLDEIGLFDEKKFGKGYGEENDFCLRASKQGWVNLLAGDTFVFHEGSVSFSNESDSRKNIALKTLTDLYPNYEVLISEHIQKNETFPLIASALIERAKQDKRPKILHILHNFSGGTEKHVKDLTEKISNEAMHFVMMPIVDEAGLHRYHIFSTANFEQINFSLDATQPFAINEFLQNIGISLIHIHHVLGYEIENLKKIIFKSKLPYYITVHDYFFICPQITLTHQKTKLYCREPSPHDCNICISHNDALKTIDIVSWRERYKNLVKKASKVICPSKDVAIRMRNYFPESKFFISYHENISEYINNEININLNSNEQKLKVAIIGIIAPHKGGEFLMELADLLKKKAVNIELKLIGIIQPGTNEDNTSGDKIISSTGLYDDSNLDSKISDYGPHVIFFTSRCPETYSYTLSSAIKSGFPILAPNIGAFPERLNLRKWSWIYDFDTTLENLITIFNDIKIQQIQKSYRPFIAVTDNSTEKINEDFYQNQYLDF